MVGVRAMTAFIWPAAARAFVRAVRLCMSRPKPCAPISMQKMVSTTRPAEMEHVPSYAQSSGPRARSAAIWKPAYRIPTEKARLLAPSMLPSASPRRQLAAMPAASAGLRRASKRDTSLSSAVKLVTVRTLASTSEHTAPAAEKASCTICAVTEVTVTSTAEELKCTGAKRNMSTARGGSMRKAMRKPAMPCPRKRRPSPTLEPMPFWTTSVCAAKVAASPLVARSSCQPTSWRMMDLR
mmetsp:Transcript_23657/g.64159  ORF Transcript_23657/g.64159 Transcript_23657/m.64159 type:complete len:239 (-) Transcript_23657:3550-4266(-)